MDPPTELDGDQATILLLPRNTDKGLEIGKLHGIIHFLWKKGALRDSLENTMLRHETNKSKSKEQK